MQPAATHGESAPAINARTQRIDTNLWPSFLFTGIQVTRMSVVECPVGGELRMRPWNRNFVRTFFGGRPFELTNPLRMLPMV
jgi:hypothetical protein